MPNEIYHKSNWGNANAEGFGDVYFDAAATNKLYNHSDYYENSNGTDKILRDLSNKASIVLTPTAYSDGSLNTVIPPYQVLPQELVTNGDFSDGTNDWSTSNSTLSLDNGYLKITSTGGNRPQANQTVLGLIAGKKYRLSAEAKRGTCVNGVEIEISGIGSTVDTNKNNTTEFKDIFYEFTATSTTHTIQAKIDDGSSTVGETAFFKIVNLKEIQEADFDFSRGSSATRVNEQGLIESIASGLPRIDYSSGFGSLLLEPQRTNKITYSEDFSQWSKTGTTSVSSNDSISPDGSQNASTVSGLTGSGSNDLVKNIGINPANKTYTFSVYLKGSGTLRLHLSNNVDNAASNVVTLTSSWVRYELIHTFNSTSASLTASLDDNGATATEYKVWGAMLEEGSYSTSYIVSNSGSATTRSADVANNSGNADLFNDSEGVLYTEISALADDLTFRTITLSDGTTNNNVGFGYRNNSNVIYTFLKSDINSSSTVTVSDIKDFNKIAIKYKSGDFAMWINGVEVYTSPNSFTLSGLTELAFDNGSGNADFYGKTKELAVFKEALTDAELESLTSWVSFTEMATDLEYTLE